jgi:hypothetical protein
VKETPIQFNAEMLRLIVDGHKTQTRRPLKPQPVHDEKAWAAYWEGPNQEGKYGPSVWGLEERPGEDVLLHCPYGRAGDRLLCDPHPSSLEILRVWVERVQDTTYDDMTAEGVNTGGPVCAEVLMLCTGTDNIDDAQRVMHRDCWASLWDSLYAKRGLGWDVNPWVWAIEFKSIEGESHD